MRLKVEVEWQGHPWRRRTLIRTLALVDAAFGLIVACLYVIKLSFPSVEPEFPALTSSDRLNNSLALVFLLVANLLQTFHSLRLYFTVSKKEGRDPASCFEASKTWFDFTEFSYLFTTVKCVIAISYLLKVGVPLWLLLMTLVTFPEVIFKLYMLYIVYGFMTDLKQCLKYFPKFRFVPVTESHSNSVVSIDIDDKMRWDINANTKLLV